MFFPAEGINDWAIGLLAPSDPRPTDVRLLQNTLNTANTGPENAKTNNGNLEMQNNKGTKPFLKKFNYIFLL